MRFAARPNGASGRGAGLLLAGLLAAASGPALGAPPPAGPEGASTRARFLMGTLLTIEVDGKVPAGAIEAAFDEVARLEEILSNWRATSELSRLNGAAALGPVRCSPDLDRAVRAALLWARRTNGAFDPTVEPLVRALGLREEAGRPPGEPAPAPDEERAGTAAPPPIGWRHVRVRRLSRTVRFDTPGVGLDLGGIGKGIALDAAASVLRRLGVRRALLDFGGQVLAMGRPVDGDLWRIGIADPVDRERAVSVLGIEDASLSTSSNSERFVETSQGRVGHILDPASARPAAFEGSVTVAAADATSADALSTALFVMGPVRGVEWAEARRLAVLYLWRDAAGSLRSKGTRAFAERWGQTTPDTVDDGRGVGTQGDASTGQEAR